MGKKVAGKLCRGKAMSARALVVAGLAGGSGKSVVAVGLAAAWREAGRTVATFKKGPDYIDAGWLARAAGRPCYNLDPYLSPVEELRRGFYSHCPPDGLVVLEGNRGLFDGVDAAGGYSTAELACQLDLPVLLVVNCSKTTRTVAALVMGCQVFDPRVRLVGVVLNQIANARHEAVIRASLALRGLPPVLGVVRRRRRDIFPMRHLGITPHQESEGAERTLAELAALAREGFDLAAIEAAMAELPAAGPQAVAPTVTTAPVRIGILRDAAFQFYYEENLEALRGAGAELVEINALTAAALPPDLDGLYIGGGFPETSADLLAENEGFRISVRNAAQDGLPIYAECGGLIFLGRAIVLEGREYPLAGVFPITFGLGKKPQAHGYSQFRVEGANPFYPVGSVIRGHEFRYSTVDAWDGQPEELTLAMERGTGFQGGRDGLVFGNVLALYTHVLASGTPAWASGLVAAARRRKSSR